MADIRRVSFSRSGRSNRSRIEGSARIRRIFNALDEETRKMVTDAVQEGAAQVQADARALVPVKSGALRDAIEVRSRLKGMSAEVGVFRSSINRGVEYANAIEFGTKHSKAQPFMVPAVERNKNAIRERIEQAMIDALVKATEE